MTDKLNSINNSVTLVDNREKLEYCREVITALRDSYLNKSIQLTSMGDANWGKSYFNEAEWLTQVLKDTNPRKGKRNG